MTLPLVSITSAFYNTGPLLLDMVKSVYAQTYTNWELILLDDGSTDDSLAIARSIQDPRVKVYTNGENRGRPFSLNRLTDLSEGRYIARMDSDDIMSPTRIEKQIRLLESDPGVDVVGTGISYLDKDDKPVGNHHVPQRHDEICRQPHRTFGLCHGSIVGKKEWFQKNRYNESFSLAIDFNLFFRSYQSSRFANVCEPLYYYRLDNSFNLKKQFVARQVGASFLYEYYSQKGQRIKAIGNWFIQYGKFIITVSMFSLGLRGILMRRRYDNLTEEQQSFYQQEINAIKQIQLPVQTMSNDDVETD